VPDLTLLLLAALVVGLGAVLAARGALTRLAGRLGGQWAHRLATHTARPLAITIVLLLLKPITQAWSGLPRFALLDHLVALATVIAVTWLVIGGVRFLGEWASLRYDVKKADNLLARQALTQLRVATRIGVALVSVLGIAAALMTFDSVRQIGAGLLASAGIAGIVIGFAAQRSLGTLFAGVQIALTQPIRIDDVVIVEGEWGRIEEITLTYVVVNIWDQRRLVVPINYFIEKPFQNWTRTTSELLGTVMLYTDFTVPVDDVRAELARVLDGNPLWDGRVQNIQITDVRERSVELRVLVSAANAGNLWDLRVQVRERLLEFLRLRHPEALPRVRTGNPVVAADGPLETGTRA
jgi:small-conductance mechanosensitive channel